MAVSVQQPIRLVFGRREGRSAEQDQRLQAGKLGLQMLEGACAALARILASVPASPVERFLGSREAFPFVPEFWAKWSQGSSF